MKIAKIYKYKLKTGAVQDTTIFNEEKVRDVENKVRICKLKDLGVNTVQKAMHKIDFYTFSNIQMYFPNISTSSEFIKANNYLGGIDVEVSGQKSQIDAISQSNKIAIATSILETMAKGVRS